MRVKTVEFAGKKITVREMKIKELNALADKLGVEFDKVFKAENTDDVKTALITALKDNIPKIFNDVAEGDIDEAYPSEIEELIRAFIDVNFFGVKKVLTSMAQLQAR
ncbi:MAG: hypothetical protein JG776_448 [Caloramator sp.]|jgi:predicted RecB family endonuclease|uniref:hypothetical protein n=1 Tax=Caloramator sp. TaxID=1871330 RepID=UPI001DD5442F|nr:hypothetical protein [Caloramator sp.]MBZ4662766.1 hypothetical protein [Caloramator sp.]